ncbi:hypothetical protein FGK63_20090 [Ruegeria sediminis]|uniref:Cytochrome c domain-containing protein n=1 Tax=Ruegeria sediminis TaxID=2583820 RepID=A0ABY2WT01_9RHOB|nr:hypothetical protein [Ruegeria sediminis]TMV03309.1 hypothetical protein FGK63_20090 [Ruegeria sediminis]
MQVWVLLLLAAMLGSATTVAGQVPDPHGVYEETCARCHAPHAGDFVWGELKVSDGVLAGNRSGRTVDAYLSSGHGGASPDEAATLLDHFRAVRDSGRMFQEKCRICHGTALSLTRAHLIIADGELVGRYSGRNIGALLKVHGRLSPEEAKQMLDVLTRIADTQGLKR